MIAAVVVLHVTWKVAAVLEAAAICTVVAVVAGSLLPDSSVDGYTWREDLAGWTAVLSAGAGIVLSIETILLVLGWSL